MKGIYFPWSLACILLVSCSRKIALSEYKQYIESKQNGLTIQHIYGKLKISCSFIPNCYSDCLNRVQNTSPKKANGSEYETFEVKISDSAGENQFLKIDNNAHHYMDRLNYLLNDIENDAFLIQEGDTIPCAQHIFERTYNLLPYNTVLFTFYYKGRRKCEPRTFVLVDRKVANGIMDFQFDSNVFKNIPPIKPIKVN